MKDLFRLFVLKFFIIYCNAICEYPDWIQNKVWNDQKGQLTFSVTTMTGWNYRLYSDIITEWECFLQFKNETFVASRSKDTHTIFGAHYRAYLCQKFDKTAGNVTYYNLMADISEREKESILQMKFQIIYVTSVQAQVMTGLISCQSTVILAMRLVLMMATSKPDDGKTPMYERAPTRFNNKDVNSENSSNAKLIGGITGAVSFILLVTILMTDSNFRAMNENDNQRRMLLPNSDTTQTVAFSAYLSKPFDGSTFGTLREIVYDKLESNIGHAYNNYTGTFVAPISGVYAFTWSIYVAGKPDSNGNQGELVVELVVNAKVVGITHADTEFINDDDSATGFVIKSLSAGDSVLTRSSNVFKPEGHIMSGNGRARWTFSGWLIA
ncbi:unnamed protein product [Mytilus edulis]|uniref:C1q domain-containing protein n=1 Tax=Mytilus edulis TaxID=6550 RepID=A0A8S3UK53_MYTED|nr:unnamed protein product [Mytilus edulis]